MQTQASRFAKQSAVRLRKTMTDAERKLWGQLRGEQLGVKFRRQHPFAEYILDFVCLDRKLVIEVDGGQHAESTPDVIRDEALAQAGFKTLRFWNNEVLEQIESVVEVILLESAARNPSPPQPSP